MSLCFALCSARRTLQIRAGPRIAMRAISALSCRCAGGGHRFAHTAAPPLSTVCRHGPHLGALLHKIRREEGRTGSPRTALAPLLCRRRHRRSGGAQSRRVCATAIAPARHATLAARSCGDSLSLSLSCEASRGSGCAAAAVAFANLQNALRGTAMARRGRAQRSSEPSSAYQLPSFATDIVTEEQLSCLIPTPT